MTDASAKKSQDAAEAGLLMIIFRWRGAFAALGFALLVSGGASAQERDAAPDGTNWIAGPD